MKTPQEWAEKMSSGAPGDEERLADFVYDIQYEAAAVMRAKAGEAATQARARTVEEWAEMARRVIMISHGADADRVELAEVFRRHERHVRAKTLDEIKSTIGVLIDDSKR